MLNENWGQNIYNGPCTFHRFLYIMQNLISQKTIEKTQTIQTIMRALNSIKQTKHDIVTINNLISIQKSKFQEISTNSQNILQQLINKVHFVISRNENTGL